MYVGMHIDYLGFYIHIFICINLSIHIYIYTLGMYFIDFVLKNMGIQCERCF